MGQVISAYDAYPEMFYKLLGEDRYDNIEFDTERSELPSRVCHCSAYLSTGSENDAYNTTPWISELTRFLNEVEGGGRSRGVSALAIRSWLRLLAAK